MLNSGDRGSMNVYHLPAINGIEQSSVRPTHATYDVILKIDPYHTAKTCWKEKQQFHKNWRILGSETEIQFQNLKPPFLQFCTTTRSCLFRGKETKFNSAHGMA
jgi:hypothetical protein